MAPWAMRAMRIQGWASKKSVMLGLDLGSLCFVVAAELMAFHGHFIDVFWCAPGAFGRASDGSDVRDTQNRAGGPECARRWCSWRRGIPGPDRTEWGRSVA